MRLSFVAFDEMSVKPLRILVTTLSTIPLTDRAGRVVSFVTRFCWVMLHITGVYQQPYCKILSRLQVSIAILSCKGTVIRGAVLVAETARYTLKITMAVLPTTYPPMGQITHRPMGHDPGVPRIHRWVAHRPTRWAIHQWV